MLLPANEFAQFFNVFFGRIGKNLENDHSEANFLKFLLFFPKILFGKELQYVVSVLASYDKWKMLNFEKIEF